MPPPKMLYYNLKVSAVVQKLSELFQTEQGKEEFTNEWKTCGSLAIMLAQKFDLQKRHHIRAIKIFLAQSNIPNHNLNRIAKDHRTSQEAFDVVQELKKMLKTPGGTEELIDLRNKHGSVRKMATEKFGLRTDKDIQAIKDFLKKKLPEQRLISEKASAVLQEIKYMIQTKEGRQELTNLQKKHGKISRIVAERFKLTDKKDIQPVANFLYKNQHAIFNANHQPTADAAVTEPPTNFYFPSLPTLSGIPVGTQNCFLNPPLNFYPKNLGIPNFPFSVAYWMYANAHAFNRTSVGGAHPPQYPLTRHSFFSPDPQKNMANNQPNQEQSQDDYQFREQDNAGSECNSLFKHKHLNNSFIETPNAHNLSFPSSPLLSRFNLLSTNHSFLSPEPIDPLGFLKINQTSDPKESFNILRKETPPSFLNGISQIQDTLPRSPTHLAPKLHMDINAFIKDPQTQSLNHDATKDSELDAHATNDGEPQKDKKIRLKDSYIKLPQKPQTSCSMFNAQYETHLDELQLQLFAEYEEIIVPAYQQLQQEQEGCSFVVI